MTTNFICSDTTDTTESYFSNHLLNARINSNQTSKAEYDPILEDNRNPEWKEAHWKKIKENDLNYEKDINQYITLSLSELVNPRSVTDSSYLINTASDAGQLAISFERASEVYRVFRVNADFLLFHLGLFSQNSNVLGDTCFEGWGLLQLSGLQPETSQGWTFRTIRCAGKTSPEIRKLCGNFKIYEKQVI